MIEAYHTKVVPNMLNDPTNTITILCSLKAFINDVVLHVASTSSDSLHNLQQQAQTKLHWWDQLVKVTEGAPSESSIP